MWLVAPEFDSAAVEDCCDIVADTDRFRVSTVKQDVILEREPDG